MRYYEDIEIGLVERFGRYEVTREEVIAFAAKYDPQPFHLDDATAAETHFVRLAASGWHTCSMMAMFVEYMRERREASLGGAGVDELRWLKPVYPGDVLRCEREITEKQRSRTRPQGRLRQRTTVFNQDDEPVLSLITLGLIRARAMAD